MLHAVYDRHRAETNSKLGDPLSMTDQVWLEESGTEDSALKQSGMEDGNRR